MNETVNLLKVDEPNGSFQELQLIITEQSIKIYLLVFSEKSKCILELGRGLSFDTWIFSCIYPT